MPVPVPLEQQRLVGKREGKREAKAPQALEKLRIRFKELYRGKLAALGLGERFRLLELVCLGWLLLCRPYCKRLERWSWSNGSSSTSIEDSVRIVYLWKENGPCSGEEMYIIGLLHS